MNFTWTEVDIRIRTKAVSMALKFFILRPSHLASVAITIQQKWQIKTARKLVTDDKVAEILKQ
jgi:hypothetical protein